MGRKDEVINMSKCYCKECNQICAYTPCDPVEEQVSVGGKDFMALQRHAFCDVCGAEVFPSEVVDFCVIEANDGYHKALMQ